MGEWGEGLAQFTISNATDDLAELIDRARVPGQEVVLYGLSYGTAEMWRYLARHPLWVWMGREVFAHKPVDVRGGVARVQGASDLCGDRHDISVSWRQRHPYRRTERLRPLARQGRLAVAGGGEEEDG